MEASEESTTAIKESATEPTNDPLQTTEKKKPVKQKQTKKDRQAKALKAAVAAIKKKEEQKKEKTPEEKALDYRLKIYNKAREKEAPVDDVRYGNDDKKMEASNLNKTVRTVL